MTLNNYTNEEEESIWKWDTDGLILRMAIGREIGEEGTPHLQGMVGFRKPMRFSAVVNLSPRAHWEVAKDPAALFQYCLKEGNYKVVDHRKGSSEAITAYVNDIRAGKSDQDLLDAHPVFYTRYPNAPLNIRRVCRGAPRTVPPVVFWIHGESGIGKTRWVYGRHERVDDITVRGTFVIGYHHCDAVVFDDFRFSTCGIGLLLRLLDRYPVTLDVKGGETEWNPKVIYITSPVPPEMVFNGEDLPQVRRRITHTLLCPGETEVFDLLEVRLVRGTGASCNTKLAFLYQAAGEPQPFGL